MAKEVQGRWTPVAKPEFNAVLVHASLLPDGQVLYWGRRRNPQAQPAQDLNQKFTDAYLWNPPTWVAPTWNAITGKFADSAPTPFSGESKPANKGRGWNLTTKTLTDVPNPPLGPMNLNGKDTVNLFCSGHCFLPNGGLLVIGGHIVDSKGLPQACIYDYQTNEFTAQTEMTNGRWYPSALPLPDGRVLAISGTYEDPLDNKNVAINNVPQIWSANDPNGWSEVAEPPGKLWPAYPRLHLDPNGRRVFVAGPLADSWFLELKNDDDKEIKKNVEGKTQPVLGQWKSAEIARNAGPRDYAPSVAYEPGKILYIGGGNNNDAPAKEAEYIDLNVSPLKWKTTSMQFSRRQFNATILPDGTVLVTGGTSVGGFNKLGFTGSTPNPVHEAELWNPDGNKWTTMAAENSDRCYHAIALLLPDGRVLSAGGGEYGDADFRFDGPGKPPLPPNDGGKGNQMDGQIFEPPYLFKSPRPTIITVQKDIDYATEFSVTVALNDSIKKVSLVRLGSVTHCRNMNQSFMWLKNFTTPPSATFKVPAPANQSLAPPGHYMLFVLNQDGVPSVASIVRLSPKPAAGKPSTIHKRVADMVPQIAKATQVQPTLLDHNERIIAEQARPPVVIGLTPVCPYGLGGCWAGAHDALQKMSDIDVVRPVPDQNDAVAFVYLQQDILPDINNWRSEFEQYANKDYDVRGIEMTLSGEVTKQQSSSGEQLTLASTSTRPQVTLAPFTETSQLKWDTKAKAPKPILDAETEAYKKLFATVADHPTGLTVQVTGTLQKLDANGGFSLDVRHFELPANTAS